METKINPKLFQLIAKWLNKPTFKLEDEPGYEDYREILLMYRLELQESERVRAIQKKILKEAKEQWMKLPVKSLADNPEFNLFKKELQVFCNQFIAEKERDNNICLLEDIRLAFREVRALYPSKSREEKDWLIRQYKQIDLSIVPEDTPGLGELKLEIAEWVKRQEYIALMEK